MTPLRVVFAGTPDFAVPSLEALVTAGHDVLAVYTQPDRPAGRGRTLTPPPVKRRALALGLPVFQPATLRDRAVHEALAALRPDVMVVVAYGLLLPPPLLATPAYGCLNVHASLLPRWRGAAPIQHAILAGDAETGVSIMQMDAGLDTGDVLHAVATPIGAEETAGELAERLAVLGARALLDTLERLPQGTLTPVKQDPARACHAPRLDKTQARLDWTEPAERLARRVRAFNPWPVAETRWNGTPLRIWQARAVPAAAGGGVPGEVVAQGPQGIDVATGAGRLRLLTLQLPGGRPLAAAEFVKARSLAGARLG